MNDYGRCRGITSAVNCHHICIDYNPPWIPWLSYDSGNGNVLGFFLFVRLVPCRDWEQRGAVRQLNNWWACGLQTEVSLVQHFLRSPVLSKQPKSFKDVCQRMSTGFRSGDWGGHWWWFLNTVNNSTQFKPWHWNHEHLASKSLGRENIPHAITPPSLAVWTVDTRHIKSMDLSCWCQILTGPSASSVQIHQTVLCFNYTVWLFFHYKILEETLCIQEWHIQRDTLHCWKLMALATAGCTVLQFDNTVNNGLKSSPHMEMFEKHLTCCTSYLW